MKAPTGPSGRLDDATLRSLIDIMETTAVACGMAGFPAWCLPGVTRLTLLARRMYVPGGRSIHGPGSISRSTHRNCAPGYHRLG